MTQTTTELLGVIEDNFILVDAQNAWRELNSRLSSGEPLPDQWRGKSDRDMVEAWAIADEGRKSKLFTFRANDHRFPTVKLSHSAQLTFVPLYFSGSSPDEAYALAAKWCKEHPDG
jgi:hypothetical protein